MLLRAARAIAPIIMLPLAALGFAGCSGLAMLDGGAPRTMLLSQPESIRELAASGREGAQLWVGSWNMLYLGPSSHTPREDRSPSQFAQYILESGVSVLGVLEVGQSPDLPERRNAFLDELIVTLNERSGGREWAYLLSSPEHNSNAMCGVLWDTTKVAPNGDPIELDVSAGQLSTFGMRLWDTSPHAMRFTAGDGKTDFILVVAHLQSDLGGLLAGPHRALEANELVPELVRLRQEFSDEDIVLVGDFNAPFGTEAAIQTLRDAGFEDLNQDDVGTYVFGPPFDRIFVPHDQPEFTRSFFIAVKNGYSPEEFQRHYSDHYLIATPVFIGDDDD